MQNTAFQQRCRLAKKTKNTGLSNVTQGGLDSCQICELVGLYLLPQMSDKFPMMSFGLYRDDGLACHRRIPGPTLEKNKKGIIKLLQENDFKITIETGLKPLIFSISPLTLRKVHAALTISLTTNCFI